MGTKGGSARLFFCGATLALLASACEAETADLGARDGEAGAGSAADEEVWSGYLEAFAFPSGTSEFTLRFRRADAAVQGTLTYGDGPPPPLDADDAKPDIIGGTAGDPELLFDVVDGFPFELQQASADGRRLVFTVGPADQWSAWCALQAPVAVEVYSPDDPALVTTEYSCVPENAHVEFAACDPSCPATLESGEVVSIDLERWFLCGSRLCACSEDACQVAAAGADISTMTPQQFDLHLNATDGDGTATLFDRAIGATRAVAVRLERR